MKRLKASRESGSLMVMVLLVVTISAIIGAGAIYSSRSSLYTAGHFRHATELEYLAQEGLHKAVERMQAIANPALTDPLYTKGLYSGPEKTIQYLLGVIYQEQSPPWQLPDKYPNLPCPEPFDPDVDLDVTNYPKTDPLGTANVVCNFLGNSLENVQVILVRKNDRQEGVNRMAIFLIISIARDDTGRKQIFQDLVMFSYDYENHSLTNRYYSFPAGERVWVLAETRVSEN